MYIYTVGALGEDRPGFNTAVFGGQTLAADRSTRTERPRRVCAQNQPVSPVYWRRVDGVEATFSELASRRWRIRMLD